MTEGNKFFLETGVCYLLGHSKLLHPIVYVDPSKLIKNRKKFFPRLAQFGDAIAYLVLMSRRIFFRPGKVEQLYIICDVKDVGITDVPKEVSPHLTLSLTSPLPSSLRTV